MKKEGYLRFEVTGAGDILISPQAIWRTGKAKGFDFSVTWGAHGLAGGVIDKKEARKLAVHILNALDD